MIVESDAAKYFAELETQYDLKEQQKLLNQFICKCILQIETFFPEIALNSYQIAQGFWFDNVGTPDDLEKARIQCWRYLDDIGEPMDLTTPAVISVRAVICVLYYQSDKDFERQSMDHILWFFELLNRLGNYADFVKRAMNEQFGRNIFR